MDPITAVLLDWSGTLAGYPELSWGIRRAFDELGRPATQRDIDALVHRLDQASQLSEVKHVWGTEDRSAADHRAAHRLWYESAGFDNEFAEALYATHSQIDGYRLYPDSRCLLTNLSARGIRMAVVSDIHFDIRQQFDSAGLAEFIDAYVLSFEHGIQKPDPRMFTTALEALDAESHQALMVGDWYPTDWGAAAAGITTLILPKPSSFGTRGLGTIVHLVDSSHRHR